MKTLTNDQIATVARKNGIQPAALLAVKQVEVGSKFGFLPDGKPQILFEGHIFYKLLVQNRKDLKLSELMKKNPNIIYPKWDQKQYKGGLLEWDRLEKAAKIDPGLAYQSASWGMFQIMGFNYKLCGCTSIEEFVTKMKKSAEDQLQLGINFIKNNKMDVVLNNHDWVKFALWYNGTGYKQNKYDTKLQTAYTNYLRIYPK